MKLEYLHSGSDDCPLIRVYQGSIEDYQILLNAIDQLINKEVSSIYLDELPGYIPINNICLALISSDHQFEKSDPASNSFSYGLTKGELQTMKQLIIPFLTESSSKDINGYMKIAM